MSRIEPRPTFARIDLNNLAFNYRSARQFVGPSPCMAVVKANAYGHGAVECARRLTNEGVEWFAVATMEEALELRESGITARILCLGGFYPGQEAEGLRQDITPVVFTTDAVERISAAADEKGIKAKIHVKIDTGMNRVGVPFAEIEAFLDRLSTSSLEVEGLMTHFAAADDLEENDFTDLQMHLFQRSVSLFRNRGHHPRITDIANSPGAVAHPGSRADMVRLGGILYGLGGDVLPADVDKPELRPVLSLHSSLTQVKRVPAGATVGYRRTFMASRETLIGTVPIGYQDGYCRSLSNRGTAILKGKTVPVIGRISMDWLTLDLTTVPDADVGEEVVLIGSSGTESIRAEDVARRAGTISYEITCGLSGRVPRVYV